jgi:ubiquinone/menaquinone biosynthesis C-methylase UbiE
LLDNRHKMPSISAEQQFNRQAPHYNAQWNSWNGESLAWLIGHAHCEPSQRWLDVATGAGFTAAAFAPLVAEVTALDVSTAMLAEAKERARSAGLSNLVFETGAAEALPFPQGRFDGVICRLAAHHFLSVPKFVAEAYRVLRPRGRLLVADTTEPDDAPQVDAWHNHLETLRDRSHVRNYTPSEWRRFVTEAGFAVDDVDLVRELVPITLKSWLEKGGCTGEAAAEVRRLMLEASEEVKRTFSISRLPDGDVAFQWPRVALAAIKPQ